MVQIVNTGNPVTVFVPILLLFFALIVLALFSPDLTFTILIGCLFALSAVLFLQITHKYREPLQVYTIGAYPAIDWLNSIFYLILFAYLLIFIVESLSQI